MNWYRKLNSMANKLPYGMDKGLHGIGGFLIALLLLGYLDLPVGLAVIVPTLIGVVKECADENFSVTDAIAWFVGGVIYLGVYYAAT